MKKLNFYDRRCLNAAEGWLGLGDNLSANEELRHITAEMWAHPEVMWLRWQIFANAGQWEACVYIAKAVSGLDHQVSTRWIESSYALKVMKWI
jgi:hypothetical protein